MASLRRMPLYAKLAVGVAGVAGSIGVVYVVRPSVFLSAATSYKRRQVGFRRKSISLDDGFVLSYAERGQPTKDIPTMVMIHGFTGELDATVPVAKLLPPNAHVIAIDAPAHGRSSALIEEDYQAMGMAKRLKQFTSKTGLDKQKFHLIGWAMGGTMAGFYAGQYSDDLELVTIGCPGMKCPTVAEPMQRAIDGEHHILMARSPAELQETMDLLLEKKIQLPPKILNFIFEQRMKRRKDHKKVLKYMVDEILKEDDNQYIEQIARITAPTQIVWGENDGLIDVSGAHLLADTLGANCKRKDIVPQCGHTFYMEEPHTLSGLITAFQMDYRMEKETWDKQRNEKRHSLQDAPGKRGAEIRTEVKDGSEQITVVTSGQERVSDGNTATDGSLLQVNAQPSQADSPQVFTIPAGQCVVCQVMPSGDVSAITRSGTITFDTHVAGNEMPRDLPAVEQIKATGA